MKFPISYQFLIALSLFFLISTTNGSRPASPVAIRLPQVSQDDKYNTRSGLKSFNIVKALGNSVRNLDFWTKVIHIYGSYKVTQIKIQLFRAKSGFKSNDNSENEIKRIWGEVHETNSDRMMDLCLSLRGFYLKSGILICICIYVYVYMYVCVYVYKYIHLHIYICEIISNSMMDLCLRGLYLKFGIFMYIHMYMHICTCVCINVCIYDCKQINVYRYVYIYIYIHIYIGQFLGTRHDFMPSEYTSKLCQLHDNVPPLEANEIRKVLEEELGESLDKYFKYIDLEKPIGSASVAQVHSGIWRNGEKCAVKIQYPNAEKLMVGDLKNLRFLAEFLQRTELKFDVLSAIKELQKQIVNEFDFLSEARNMNAVRKGLSKFKDVTVPQSIYSTKKVPFIYVCLYIYGISYMMCK
jgi:hypothetical protein